MKAAALPTVPLSKEDLDQLQTIYWTRRKFFYGTCTGLFAFFLYIVFRYNTWAVVYIVRGAIFAFLRQLLYGDGLLIAILLVFLISTYWLRVAPYASDCKRGCKEYVTYTVTMKQYFETTRQYFIGLDDPDYLHHEVDADFYSKVCEGDIVVLYRAPKSQYVFNERGRFTLM